MLTDADVKYWGPNPAMLTKVANRVAEGARVLEIGPGQVPFSRATHFVDWRAGENTVTVFDLHQVEAKSIRGVGSVDQ